MGEINISIIFGIILIALVTEAVVNSLKRLMPIETKIPIAILLALGTSIALCTLANLDIMVAFGYPLKEPVVGCVVTGIVASLGANAIYDLVESYKDYQGRLAVEKREEDIYGTYETTRSGNSEI